MQQQAKIEYFHQIGAELDSGNDNDNGGPRLDTISGGESSGAGQSARDEAGTVAG